MTTSSSTTSIYNLPDESLAKIFSFLPPDVRVRVERVCRRWRHVAKTLAWSEFKRLLTLDHKLAKFRALLNRSAPHLRELSITERIDRKYDVELWARMRNLRHLRFDECCASVETLHAIADNLTRLQSIHFCYIDWCSDVTVLRDLLCANNKSLQALRLPMGDSRFSLRLPALPSGLRLLHISDGPPGTNYFQDLRSRPNRDRIDELLEVAASCCPQLAMLMLPTHFTVNAISLAKLARFEKLFYLRLAFTLPHAALFADTLGTIGARLRALLLEMADMRVLHQIAKYCPLLEHCSFRSIYCSPDHEQERLISALHSVFQLANLRSVSMLFIFIHYGYLLRAQILDVINGLNAKGNIEYLHMSRQLPLSVEFIINLIQRNTNLRKLTCEIQQYKHTPAQMDELKMLLQNRDRPMELELLEYCPPKLEMDRVRVRKEYWPESISQPMLREFWAREMDAVPDLGNLDD